MDRWQWQYNADMEDPLVIAKCYAQMLCEVSTTEPVFHSKTDL